MCKYREVFGEHDYDVGMNSEIKMQIDTGDSPPIYIKRQISVPISQRQAVSEILECMQGIIRKSHSPWAVPMLVVPKKDGRLRIVIDYRPLNRVLKGKMSILFPRIEGLLSRFHGMKYFHNLGFEFGFHYYKYRGGRTFESRKQLFVCFTGLVYEYNKMPMGPQ